MRTIGIDLAVTGAHKAVVTDAAGQALTPVLTVFTDPTSLDALLARAREGEPERMPLRAVMEPTGLPGFQ